MLTKKENVTDFIETLWAGDQSWPFFYYTSISCNRNIVSRNSMILINKLGVTVGILLIAFLE